MSDTESEPKPAISQAMTNEIGQIFVFDKNGEQIPELQRAPFLYWAEHAEALGYDVEGLRLETMRGVVTLTKQQNGWNFIL